MSHSPCSPSLPLAPSLPLIPCLAALLPLTPCLTPLAPVCLQPNWPNTVFFQVVKVSPGGSLPVSLPHSLAPPCSLWQGGLLPFTPWPWATQGLLVNPRPSGWPEAGQGPWAGLRLSEALGPARGCPKLPKASGLVRGPWAGLRLFKAPGLVRGPWAGPRPSDWPKAV